MTTQNDVAKLAGVSRRTVSNVVNGYPHVSEDVLRRVSAAILELGYTPSQAARSLRSGRSGLLQLVVPELDVPYFSELARGIVEAADSRGYAVLVRQTLGSREAESEALFGVAGKYSEGTILSPVGPAAAWLEERPPGHPVVLIGEHGGAGAFVHVGIDDEAAAFEAATLLISQGRRRIAFVGADPHGTLLMARKREAGYRRALSEAGLGVDERLVVATRSYHRADGSAALSDLWESVERPDAVFCATDLLAVGVLRRAHELAVAVPSDVSVVGFDDLEEGRFSVPSLTTVSPDKASIARAAVDALVGLVEGERGAVPDSSDVRVGFELRIRESSDVRS